MTSSPSCPSHLSGGSSPAKHLGFLDTMRGVAIMIVFLHHALGEAFGINNLRWDGWIRDFHVPASFLIVSPFIFGSVGVAFFFAISGFCIHLSWSNSQQLGFGRFYVRRFFRIYPPYLVALLIFSFLWPIHSLHVGDGTGMTQLLSHLFLVHNLNENTFLGINGSFWSIAVEWQLYMIYPLFLVVTQRIGWQKSLLFIALLEMGCRIAVGLHDTWTPDQPVSRLLTGSPFYFWFSWASGAAVAEDYLGGKVSFLHRMPVWFFPALIVPAYLFRPLATLVFPLAALAGARCIAGFCTKAPSGMIPHATMSQFLGALGVISYSFYLLHQPVLQLMERILRETPLFASLKSWPLLHFGFLLTCLVTTAFCSFLFWKMVEQPSISLGKRFRRRITMPRLQSDSSHIHGLK